MRYTKAEKERLGISRTKMVSKSCQERYYLDGSMDVVLYNTTIFRKQNGKIILNTGGWNTVTTIKRINQYSGHYKIYISSYKGELKITTPKYNFSTEGFKIQKALPFKDNMEIGI